MKYNDCNDEKSGSKIDMPFRVLPYGLLS